MNFKFLCYILNFISPNNISGPLPSSSGYVTKPTRPYLRYFFKKRSMLNVYDTYKRRSTNFLCNAVAKKVRRTFQNDSVLSPSKFAFLHKKPTNAHIYNYHFFTNTLPLRHASGLKGPSLWRTTAAFQQQGQLNDLPYLILFSEQPVIYHAR